MSKGFARLSATPDSCPGAKVLDETLTFLKRFVAYPSEAAAIAHALWVAHTHAVDAFESTPRIAFLSPEPGSGKTRALEATEPLVPRPIEAVNVTPAYLFRKVGDSKGKPTILFDEIDTVFGPRAKDNEEIRGLLNAGHRRGAVAGRCVVRGKVVETEEIPAYCAVALAGLDDLPDTLMTRSVVVRMRKRSPTETVQPWRRRIHAPQGEIINRQLAKWIKDVFNDLQGNWPEMPAGIEDRNADVWEPLLAIADAAGGEWPQRARAAAVAMVEAAQERVPSLGVRLLSDLRAVFGDRDVMPTEELLASLHALPEAPWAELRGGKPLNDRGLAQRLHRYGIKSKTIRTGDCTAKGYAREDLYDVWVRYCPSASLEWVTSVTSVTNNPWEVEL